VNTHIRAQKTWMYFLLATALPTLWGSSIQNNPAIFVQTPLNIQTSKVDPPRIAFDEINSSNLKKENLGASLNLNEAPKIPGNVFNRKIILSSMVFTKDERAQEVQRIQSTEKWVETLSPTERRRVETANIKFASMEADLRKPSFKEMAQEKIEQIHKEMDSQPIESPKVIVQGSQALQKSDVQVKASATGFDVSGEFILRGLPPPSANWHVHIARYDDDVKKEDASIDTKRAIYKIRVPALTGSITAQLIDSNNGMVIGEGSYRLSHFVADKISGQARIVIEPASHTIATNYRTFYNQTKPVPKARTMLASVGSEGQADASGAYKFEGIKNGSWTLLRTESKGYYPSMNLVRAGNEKDLTLYPQKMIEALRQIVSDQALVSEFAENGSVVWGRIQKDGKPQPGVEVDIEYQDGFRAVYFNSLMLPDPTLKATSENGYYAFLDLPEGFHSVVASQNEAYLSHVNVVVDENTISTGNIDLSSTTERVSVKAFDAFTGNPQQIQLEMQGLGQSIAVNGYAEINLAPIHRLSLLRSQPSNPEFIETRQVYEDSDESVHIPLIRNAWIQDVIARRKMTIYPDTGIVVSCVSDENYEMYLGHVESFSADNIVYFDAQGNITENSVPGGGVIVFNVPAGTQSFVVADNQSQMLQSQVVPVDSGSVTILKFR
jgi:hypothetical protein